MARGVTLILLAWATAGRASESQATEPAKIVYNIQRKLMEDNYDYMSSSREIPARRSKGLSREERLEAAPGSLDKTLNVVNKDHFVPHTVDLEPHKEYHKEDEISLKYEEHEAGTDNYRTISADNIVNAIAKRRNIHNYGVAKRQDADAETGDVENHSAISTETPNPKVKYNILTVREGDHHTHKGEANRRSGWGNGRRSRRRSRRRRKHSLKSRSKTNAVRWFVDERRPGEVALVGLGAAPAPGFRLPRARRQYMRHRRDPASEDDAPAPAQYDMPAQYDVYH